MSAEARALIEATLIRMAILKAKNSDLSDKSIMAMVDAIIDDLINLDRFKAPPEGSNFVYKQVVYAWLEQ